MDIEIKVNSTLNEEEAEEIDGLGELPLKRVVKKGVISTACETLDFEHMFPQSSSKSVKNVSFLSSSWDFKYLFIILKYFHFFSTYFTKNIVSLNE